MKFGIGLRDKQKLNLDVCGDGGATYDQWLDRHQPWSQLGQVMEGKAATGGYNRAEV